MMRCDAMRQIGHTSNQLSISFVLFCCLWQLYQTPLYRLLMMLETSAIMNDDYDDDNSNNNDDYATECGAIRDECSWVLVLDRACVMRVVLRLERVSDACSLASDQNRTILRQRQSTHRQLDEASRVSTTVLSRTNVGAHNSNSPRQQLGLR